MNRELFVFYSLVCPKTVKIENERTIQIRYSQYVASISLEFCVDYMEVNF